MPTIVETLSKELNKKEEYVQNVVTLLDEGNTVPSSPIIFAIGIRYIIPITRTNIDASAKILPCLIIFPAAVFSEAPIVFSSPSINLS